MANTPHTPSALQSRSLRDRAINMITQTIQSNPSPAKNQSLPTMYDLPSEYVGEPAWPDEFHPLQSMLLMLTFIPPNWNREMVFSAMDLYLYYDVNHRLWYKRPDWFGVVGVPRLYEERDLRLSYVIWQEKVSPFVVVELLSPGTEKEDLGKTEREPEKPPTKWEVYEQILKVLYYVVLSRYTRQIKVFHLVNNHYQPAPLTQGRLQIPSLELSLGLWEGSYCDIERLWLRWLNLDGTIIPIPSEEVAEAKRSAADAKQEAE